MADYATRRGVRETYDRIGSHFARTRERPWPAVERFIETDSLAPNGTTVGLDLGCGNARHAEVMTSHVERVVGVDVSRRVLETARERRRERGFSVELCHADATALPLASRTIHLAVYIAAIHHLPTRETRLESLDELARVLAPGGHGLVSTWSTTHERFNENDGFDTTVDWTLPGGETVPRYYHIYDPAEFETDLAESELGVERVFAERGNCYGVVTAAEGKPT